jgi:hypothetical protein
MVNNMARLQADLRFFEQELERERDPFRRILLLRQIRDIKQEILNLLRQQRAREARILQNLQDLLNTATKNKKW